MMGATTVTILMPCFPIRPGEEPLTAEELEAVVRSARKAKAGNIHRVEVFRRGNQLKVDNLRRESSYARPGKDWIP